MNTSSGSTKPKHKPPKYPPLTSKGRKEPECQWCGRTKEPRGAFAVCPACDVGETP